MCFSLPEGPLYYILAGGWGEFGPTYEISEWSHRGNLTLAYVA